MNVNIDYEPHSGQMEFHKSQARIRVLACGRRWGKTTAAVVEALLMSLSEPGTRGWVVAPSYDLTKRFENTFTRLVPRKLYTHKAFIRQYTLLNGSIIELKSAVRPDASLLGEGLDWLIVDEAAIIDDDVWVQYLSPSLLDCKGRAIFISTPRGHNWFHTIWTRGRDEEYADYKSWQRPSSENPAITTDAIQTMIRDVQLIRGHDAGGEIIKQELYAEFLAEDALSVFRLRDHHLIDAQEVPAKKSGETYYFGIDLAQSSDYTVITGVNNQGTQVYLDRWTRMSWNAQFGRVLTALNKYPRAHIIVDATNTPKFAEDLQRRLDTEKRTVEAFRFTNTSKREIVDALALAFEKDEIRIINNLVQVNEIKGFQLDMSGKVPKYNARPGLNDDCVDALAMAWYAYKQVGAEAEVELIELEDW